MRLMNNSAHGGRIKVTSRRTEMFLDKCVDCSEAFSYRIGELIDFKHETGHEM